MRAKITPGPHCSERVNSNSILMIHSFTAVNSIDSVNICRRQLDELRQRIKAKMPPPKSEAAATSSPSKHRLPTVIGKGGREKV